LLHRLNVRLLDITETYITDYDDLLESYQSRSGFLGYNEAMPRCVFSVKMLGCR
jgi:hypothetical protein